ncbi:hydrophobic/amphiphilic exporter-1, HAE1 family [Filimonas lacunae]|uniref:Hydrophobic/amphiphilic exporter-1, HAE1 family n=1 Tax=Filimonas lacunae TaxID=477680 RepID=A0A173MD69_9BACT|nr:efflux RND transporter permease subunit [Filimonas lacunae]BAV05533.1 cation/multidrug efflux pump [Filimonas lacunae]SIT20521.1 hydrophobic/amphiphilic exporter-1, HAE1 family [Filimonas lacunae]
MSITEIAVKRPLLITVIFSVLILFGIQCYFKLNYNLLPKIQVNTVTISTVYPGAAVTEVETSVTKKLEDILASVEGLDQINATSQQGVSVVTVTLKPEMNVDDAERDIQRKIDQSINDLPTTADKPLVKKVNLEETPVIQAGITANMDARDLYNLVDKQMKPALQNVPGVGQLNIIGGDERQIQVNIRQDKLNAYHIGIEQLTQAITNANQSFPAGSLETDKSLLSIHYDANIVSVEELRNLIIYTDDKGGTVYLKDIASISDASVDATAVNAINGTPSIGIQVIKQSDANAVNLSKAVKAKFSELETQYATKGIHFTISADQSTYTLSAANAVMEDLGLAILIVGVVMLAFLHSVRSSMFVLIALPSSIIPTFIAMYFCGFSLNLMSLMAMSLVVGILVDDSIVVLENIYRHLEMGKDRRIAALEGRNEIGFTALAITLVDVVVFLPLALSGGIIGAILKEFSLVVVFSTLMSLFVSFTITPLLASRFGRLEHLNKGNLWGRMNLGFEAFITGLKNDYGKMLAFLLGKKRWLLSGVIILLIGSFMLLAKGFIGAAFIPVSDQGQLLIKLETAPGTALYQTNMVTREAEQMIRKHPEVINTFASVGFVAGTVAGSSGNSNQAEISVTIVNREQRSVSSDEFGIQLQKQLSQTLAGVKVSAASTSISGNSSAAPIQIAIEGTDMEKVRQVANTYKNIISSIPGTQSVELSVKDPKPEISLHLHRDKMMLLGIDARKVGSALQNAFNGDDNGKFREQGNEYPLMIRFEASNRATLEDIRRLSFSPPQGGNVTLDQFADVYLSTGETVLQRRNRLSNITVNSNVVGRPTGSVADDIKKQLATVTIPEGIHYEFLGDTKNQQDAFGSLGMALLTAILLVYLIMVALYENAVYPFVVLFSIPVALIGSLLALALTMETLNIFSIIGIIMLLGLVSKNAILIVDFTNQLKAEGKPVHEALVEAGKERMRPILMTTLAMILGMLPIALANGAGSEIKNGMAWVIIGGLTSSMILTLFVVPAMYLIIDRLIHRKKKTQQSLTTQTT